jgi:hypothetical protein
VNLILGYLIIALLVAALFVELRLIARLVDDLRKEYGSGFYKEECKREDEQGNRVIQKVLRKFNELFARAMGAFFDGIRSLGVVVCAKPVKLFIVKLVNWYIVRVHYFHKTGKRIFTRKPPKGNGKRGRP